MINKNVFRPFLLTILPACLLFVLVRRHYLSRIRPESENIVDHKPRVVTTSRRQADDDDESFYEPIETDVVTVSPTDSETDLRRNKPPLVGGLQTTTTTAPRKPPRSPVPSTIAFDDLSTSTSAATSGFADDGSTTSGSGGSVDVGRFQQQQHQHVDNVNVVIRRQPASSSTNVDNENNGEFHVSGISYFSVAMWKQLSSRNVRRDLWQFCFEIKTTILVTAVTQYWHRKPTEMCWNVKIVVFQP